MTAQPSAPPPLETIRFPVAGMVCGSCVARITRAVKRLDGVSAVRVDLRREAVTVRREPGRPPDRELAAAVATAGYEADLSAARLIASPVGASLLDRLLARWG